MKFGTKLSLAITGILCVTLSLGGSWTIHQNFRQTKEDLLRQCSRSQLYERYTLEASFTRQDTSITSISAMARQYARERRAVTTERTPAFALFGENGTILYSDLSHEISFSAQQEAILAGEALAHFLKTEEGYSLLMAAPLRGLDQQIWLVSAYDATPQFRERNRQISQYFFLQVSATVLAGIAAVFVSRLLTRSLKTLESASRELALGNTGVQVLLHSGDELEELGKTFNEMSLALEHHIALLQEETERQKRFVAAFTHELKTPMTAILGYSSLLRSGDIPLPQRRKAADYIYSESCRLEALSRELLILLGLEKGELHLEAVPVHTLYREVYKTLPEPFPTIQLCCKERVLLVEGDRILLGTLLRNLILNAAAAEPRDGKIALNCSRCPEGVCLAVTDKGRGIPQEELSRITEPFYRVDKSRSREKGGNGLGLSICALIARLHGSKLRLESREGEGTRVWFNLREWKGDGE